MTFDLTKLYSRIKKSRLTFPSEISEEAQDLLTRVLNKDPQTRLGGYDKNELKNHSFFSGIDWKKVEIGWGKS